MRVAIAKLSEAMTWRKGGQDINYDRSHIVRRPSSDPSKVRYYSKLTFSYELGPEPDTIYFAYCFPYTLSKL